MLTPARAATGLGVGLMQLNLFQPAEKQIEAAQAACSQPKPEYLWATPPTYEEMLASRKALKEKYMAI